MTEHRLKTWPELFQAQADGRKPFEVRKNDRNFQVGDVLRLEEWQACDCSGHGPHKGYTGRMLPRVVVYVMQGGKLGLAEGWCVLGTTFPLTGWARAEYDRG